MFVLWSNKHKLQDSAIVFLRNYYFCQKQVEKVYKRQFWFLFGFQSGLIDL